jgi:hypothetical protein
MPVQIVYVTAAMMVIALFPLPEAYYNSLNVMVFGTFGWGAYRNLSPGSPTLLLALVYALFAIVYNPLSQVYLPKEAFMALDVAGAVLILITRRHIAV